MIPFRSDLWSFLTRHISELPPQSTLWWRPTYSRSIYRQVGFHKHWSADQKKAPPHHLRALPPLSSSTLVAWRFVESLRASSCACWARVIVFSSFKYPIAVFIMRYIQYFIVGLFRCNWSLTLLLLLFSAFPLWPELPWGEQWLKRTKLWTLAIYDQ